MVKRLLSIMIAVAMILALAISPAYAAPEPTDAYDDSETEVLSDIENWIDSADVTWYEGNENALEYEISTAEAFAGVSKLVNDGTTTFSGKTIKLTQDINLNSKDWTPIGKRATPFNGIFDGQNQKISNLKADRTSSYTGLFGFTADGEIKNFTLENVNIKGKAAVGAVAGGPYTSKYTNIDVIGNIQVYGTGWVGGALGYNNYGSVTDVNVIGDETSYVICESNGAGLM